MMRSATASVLRGHSFSSRCFSRPLSRTAFSFNARDNLHLRRTRNGSIAFSLPPGAAAASSQLEQRRQFTRKSSPPPRAPRGRVVNTVLTLGAAASLLAGKGKFILTGLKILKLKPLLSMGVSVWAYSLFWGWPFAAGFVGLIFVHECGHAAVMRHYGVPFSPMVFVPFIGAAIAMEEPAKNAYEEAVIAIGGPVLGTLGAAATALVAESSGSQLLFALADTGYMINLFNLLPIGSMDGGRIGNAISPAISAIGLAGGGYLAYQGSISNPIFYLILLGGTYSFASRILGWEEHASKGSHYYNIGPRRQATLAAAYGGLVVALLALMNENSKRKKSPQQLKYEQDRNIDEGATSPWEQGDFRIYEDDPFATDGDDDGW